MLKPVSNRGESTPLAKGDAVFAVSMIAVALLTMWGVRNQPKAPYDPVGAAAVPFWTAVVVLALAVLLLVRVLLRRSTRGSAISMFTMSEAIDDSYAVRPWLSAHAIVLSFAYAAGIPIVGFMYASLGFMLILGWLLSDRSPRALALVAAVAIVGSVGIDLGFRALLIDLP
jgi:putative tricarboxylic transport membrane protein